jgi:hypothetical protein
MLYLVDDAGSEIAGSITPGSGIAKNSQCSIAGSGIMSASSGTDLVLTIPIAINPDSQAMSGRLNIYTGAQDNEWNRSGWVSFPDVVWENSIHSTGPR